VSDKSIIIIGGGIAGLSAGCYGRMNGFCTRIFEMHKKPGGLCTSWKRQGYVIDGCLHWVVGSGPGSGLHSVWQELGAFEGRQFIHNDIYMHVEGPDGSSFSLPADIDRMERAMKELSPGDAPVIDEFVRASRTMLHIDMPVGKAPELMNLWDTIKFFVRFFPMLKTFRMWNRISLEEFAERFRHPLLRHAFREFFLPDFPVVFALMIVGWLHRKNAGYPLGGSLEFSRGIERRYLSLGGEISYRARVAKILVENGRAVGVRLTDGNEHRADYVVSAADGHATIFEMLDGKFVDPTIRSYYDNLPIFPSLIHVALGVHRTFDDAPRCVEGFMLHLQEPLSIGNDTHHRLWIHIYNFDPTLAPPGRTLVKALIPADYQYWKDLHEQPERYSTEKERIAGHVVAALDRRFPGLANHVEMRDIASPTTFVRYTGNWRGSVEGWIPAPQAGGMRLRISKVLPDLDRFYMAGQWVEPGGGVPTVAVSGRNVIQIICKREKKKFVTMTP
jgi:phytoene dehydrogenase-like protein